MDAVVPPAFQAQATYVELLVFSFARLPTVKVLVPNAVNPVVSVVSADVLLLTKSFCTSRTASYSAWSVAPERPFNHAKSGVNEMLVGVLLPFGSVRLDPVPV